MGVINGLILPKTEGVRIDKKSYAEFRVHEFLPKGLRGATVTKEDEYVNVVWNG